MQSSLSSRGGSSTAVGSSSLASESDELKSSLETSTGPSYWKFILEFFLGPEKSYLIIVEVSILMVLMMLLL